MHEKETKILNKWLEQCLKRGTTEKWEDLSLQSTTGYSLITDCEEIYKIMQKMSEKDYSSRADIQIYYIVKFYWIKDNSVCQLGKKTV